MDIFIYLVASRTVYKDHKDVYEVHMTANIKIC